MSQQNASFKINPAFQKAWREGLGDLASVMKKSDPESIHKLAQQSAGRFVKNIVSVTPPAQGVADSQAKARGEQAVLDDVLKLAIPVTVSGSPKAARAVLASAEEILAAHDRSRSGAAGRVNPRSRKEKLLAAQATFNAVVRQLQGRVGWLAAGLNAAADRLGVRLPAWITRHGSRFGKIEVAASDAGIRIRITQNVSFESNVKDYDRHWNFALKKEINTLHAQVKAIFARRTGKFHSRLK